MKKLILALGFLLVSISAFSQVSPQIQGAGAPANPCVNGGQQYVDTTNHLLYGCPANGQNWALLGIGNVQANTATITSVGAPAGNCFSTTVYDLNTSNGDFYDCPTPGGAWVKVNGAGGGSSAFSAITAGTNTAALVMGAGGSLVPNSTAQITDDSIWVPFDIADSTPPVPSLTAALTGGTLPTAGNIYVRITFVGAANVIPSPEVVIQLNSITGCGSASLCSVTVTMPSACTTPSAPVTGCTVWDANTSNLEKQQAASAACVNITAATCVIGTLAAGTTLSSVAATTSGINPPNRVAVSLPDFMVPSAFMQKANGNYPLWAIDTSALNYISCCFTSFGGVTPPTNGNVAGTFSWLDRFFVNDDNAPPPISNTLVSIKHMSGATTSTLTNPGSGIDDRAISVRIDNTTTSNPNYEQYLAQYNEAYNQNNNFTCNPVSGGSPWGESCSAAGRFVNSDFRTSNVVSGTYFEGVAGVANSGGSATAQANGGFYIGVKGGAYQQNVPTASNGSSWVGGLFGVNAAPGNTGTGLGYGMLVFAPATRFATRNTGIEIKDFGTNVADWNIFSDGNGTSGRNLFQGPLWLPAIVASNGTIAATGSFGISGSLSTSQLPAPTTGFTAAPFGTAGANTVNYKASCVDVNGWETTVGVAVNVTTSNADLTAAHGNSLFITTGSVEPKWAACSSANIYRTGSASTCNGGACTNGKIGNISTNLLIGFNEGYVGSPTLNDTGQVGDGNTSAAQANTTGGLVLAGLERDAGTCRLLTDTSLTVNTVTNFCSFNLPASALGWAFHCDGIWAITAGSGTNTFALGVNASQTPAATTNVAATIDTSTVLAGSDGVVALSASGATPILTSGTITPAATLEQFQVNGTISASAVPGTFAITAAANGTTATAAVKAGTQCRIF